MTNPNALKTQRRITVPIGLDTCRATLTAQWLLEGSNTRAIHPGNTLKLLICGQEGFQAIAADIEQARDSIDLVCWGFDPGMALVRSAAFNKNHPWAQGEPFGALLKRKAEQGVSVRLLVWYDAVASAKQNSLVGYVVPGQVGAIQALIGPDAWARRSQTTQELSEARNVNPRTGIQYKPVGYLNPSPAQRRDHYCVDWWRQATSGHIANLEVRFRQGDAAKVKVSVADETSPPSASAAKWGLDSEKRLIEGYATHHQKPILIDYAHEGGLHAVGYVMGLNSVSDYWDTPEHVFDDPLREPDYDHNTDDVARAAGRLRHNSHSPDGTAISRKPLRDYAARIQGQALIDVHENFATAWNQAQALPQLRGGRYTRAQAPTQPKPRLKPRLNPSLKPAKLHTSPGGVNIQVLRTQPECAYQDQNTTYPFEKSIKHAYFQASSYARNYLYLENQYFFYEEWAQHIQACRQRFMQWVQEAGKDCTHVHILHLIAVIPVPEEAGMVPRTYDTLKALGQGQAMPNQRAMYEDEYKQDQAITAQQAQWDAAHPAPTMDEYASRPASRSMSTVAQDSQAIQEPTLDKDGVLMLNGKNLGLKTLVVKLVTPNKGTRVGLPAFRDIYIHSKLMMIDDSFTTLGSANLNLRSMAADSEINIATDSYDTTQALRQRVWGNLTGGAYDGKAATPVDIADTFKKWKSLAGENKDSTMMGANASRFTGFIVQFEDTRSATHRYG